ncbi:MAG TPA: DUF2332 family protein, partial [Ilumatobacteraceae bacterium]|nr:DUF2332 family protein [Ilumatobacteraceae bacterium]
MSGPAGSNSHDTSDLARDTGERPSTRTDLASATVADALARQAHSCRLLGSPVAAAVFDAVGADYASGGVTAAVLDGVTSAPIQDAIPLRLLACAHRLALRGDAPALARHYESCGWQWDGDA